MRLRAPPARAPAAGGPCGSTWARPLTLWLAQPAAPRLGGGPRQRLWRRCNSLGAGRGRNALTDARRLVTHWRRALVARRAPSSARPPLARRNGYGAVQAGLSAAGGAGRSPARPRRASGAVVPPGARREAARGPAAPRRPRAHDARPRCARAAAVCHGHYWGHSARRAGGGALAQTLRWCGGVWEWEAGTLKRNSGVRPHCVGLTKRERGSASVRDGRGEHAPQRRAARGGARAPKG
ncbi:MAG: hypothetical protein J3K34DRAFT_422824 [Monoraphidium minutum]|nr:MAG: hypothetical protein J3K34DRAFT_422824 [Monoraphidium minutum]